ncbi:MAG: ribosome silencing factor [Acidobacteria bacterium]|nr:MAG: ribosome silencing factor [Acidobacteriota bacterium]
MRLKERYSSTSQSPENVSQDVTFESIDERVKLAITCAAEKKALGTVLLDLREVADFTDFFIITSGSNQRQVQAISDEIEEKMKRQFGETPLNIEGYNSAEWILMDYGDFIVHIFGEKEREFYDLERLWRDARTINIPEDL